jgi:alpha-L-fucosidase
MRAQGDKTTMEWNDGSRRSFMKQLGAAGAMALAATKSEGMELPGVQVSGAPGVTSPEQSREAATRAERMAWWHQARFGMKIHWGLYSVVGQREWVKELQGVPIPQYELLAKHFHPKPNVAREWARLAKRAGQKYMIMTTKHHEGFVQWDSKLTDYNAMKQGPGRDLVREYVEAARAEGLRVGFYYSLMDWHHPDGAICETDEAARKRFVEYTHGLIRELMTNYGKVDILWYDVSRPLTAAQWESERMNEMVFELQSEIIVGRRNGLPGDFDTVEQRIEPEKPGRAWETNMTIMTTSNSWGFLRGDDELKTPRAIVNNLVTSAMGGGNYLLNIGAEPDGSLPPKAVAALETVGKWLEINGKAIYGTEPIVAPSDDAHYTRRGNTLGAINRFAVGV